MRGRTGISTALAGAVAAVIILAVVAGFFATRPPVERIVERPVEKIVEKEVPPTVGTITAVTWAGANSDALRIVASGFQRKTGIVVNVALQGGAGETRAKLEAAKGRQTLDVWFSNEANALIAARKGLLEVLDETKIPNAKSLVAESRFIVDGKLYGLKVSRGYVGLIVRSDIVNVELIKSWKDMWRKEFAKKVGISQFFWFNGGNAYTAAKIWGGDERNIDVGFQKLVELVPNIAVLYSTDAEVVRLLVSGQAPILWAPLYNAKHAADLGAPIKVVVPQDAPVFTYTDVVVLVKDSLVSSDVKHQFLNFLLDKQELENFVNNYADEPLTVNPVIRADIRTYVGFKNLYDPDISYIVEKWPEWNDRWNKEIRPRLGG